MQALIRVGSSQYLVSEGQEVNLPFQAVTPEKYAINDVLLLIDGETVKVGQPTLDDVSVNVSLVNQVKGEKIRVFKFKAKSKYRKTLGFRSKFTRVKIDSITSGSAKRVKAKS